MPYYSHVISYGTGKSADMPLIGHVRYGSLEYVWKEVDEVVMIVSFRGIICWYEHEDSIAS